MSYDVAIVGYGPTGLAAASLLARAGHRVIVFERWPTLYGLPRMATIDAESARILQAACDIDVALRRSLARERYVFATERGEILVDHHWDGMHACGYPHRISLHQPDIEDAMDQSARTHGAEICQGWEVEALDAGTLSARERASGRTRTLEARYVIAADGARSTLRRLLGIECDTWPVRNAWLTFDGTRKRALPNFFGVSPDGQIAAIFCLPQGRSHSVIPLGRDHIRFNFEVDPDTPHDGSFDHALGYAKLAAVYGIGPDDVELYRQAIYPFEGRLARRWRDGRVFLAGDAAHAMTPFLGQGGCSALRDAINLAWKLDFVLRGIAPESLLESYERERMPQARFYVEASDRAASIAFVRDPAAAAARDARYLAGGAPPTPVAPIIEAGLIDSGAPRHALVGTVAPQFEIDGRRGDEALGWGFQLWCREPLALDAAERAFLERIGARVAVLGERAWFREHAIEAALVRPDFIVFGVAPRRADAGGLVGRLRCALEV